MVSDIYSARLFIANLIRDLLTELATDETVTGLELDEVRDNFGRVSDIILDELGLEVVEFADGVAKVQISPPDGWVSPA
jgi:hypothetical protein